MNSLKIGFCGSGRFAALALRRLARERKPEWVVTNAPSPSGRGMNLKNTPVWDEAGYLCVARRTTKKLSADTELIGWIRERQTDVILVIDFGQMIKEPVLSAAPLGCINIHPSALPEYRGPAPLQRAIMDGRTQSAVTLFRLDEGMDSGPILSQIPIAIGSGETYEQLLERCAALGTDELIKYICHTPASDWIFREQPAKDALPAPKIDKKEGKIEWELSSLHNYNKIRAIGGAPGVYCFWNGKRLRINAAEPADGKGKPGEYIALEGGMPVVSCGAGALKLLRVQPEGKRVLGADEWLRGARAELGERFS